MRLLYADMAYVENKVDDNAFLGYVFYSAGLAIKRRGVKNCHAKI